MKPMPQTFSKHGYSYNLLRRTDKGALYEQIHKTAGVVAWEVMRIGHHQARDTGSFKVEAGEHLPSTTEWGRRGWTLLDESAAQHRLNAIS